MKDYDNFSKEQLLELVKAQDEESIRSNWGRLILNILLFLLGALLSWIFQCFMMG